MNVFNPRILDASIRDVSSCLNDNQKADVLIYAMRNFEYKGPSKVVFDNAIQSCLQMPNLLPESIARARILRAKARLHAGAYFAAEEDLQAALVADPGNPEANALLHRRSVTLEKILSPAPTRRKDLSMELWREIALFLPRRDLQTLLFVPHALSRVAAQLLFRKIDLHLSDSEDFKPTETPHPRTTAARQLTRHTQRSADILARIITDQSFAPMVRALRIYAFHPEQDGRLAFEAGMLANAFPKLHNLRHVHISAGQEGLMSILHILQTAQPYIRTLSVHVPIRSSLDLSALTFQRLTHLSVHSETECPPPIGFLTQNRTTLRALCLENSLWTFPEDGISVRNLTVIRFTGRVPADSQLILNIFKNGYQLEALCLDCEWHNTISAPFRSYPTSLPSLKHFAFSMRSRNWQHDDRDLFPSICGFLRDRKKLETLVLTAEVNVLTRFGFDASVWGVLPSLSNLKGLRITYPYDLTPGLAGWLVPRTVSTLSLVSLDMGAHWRPFLHQLRGGVPPELRFVGFYSCGTIPEPDELVKEGFPMARVLRVESTYWTVQNGRELEVWPARRARFHAEEWLEWLGCDEGIGPASWRELSWL